MTTEITFVKEHGSWYADLPEYIKAGGSKAECLMVGGAHELLDAMGVAEERLTVRVSDKARWWERMDEWMTLDYTTEHGWGLYSPSRYVDIAVVPLCPVASFVFGPMFPRYLFLKVLWKGAK